KMNLENASSGLQSVIPMWVYLDYLFNKQYSPNEMLSSKTESENEEIAQHVYDSKYKKAVKKAAENGELYFGKVGVTKRMFASKEDFEEFKTIVNAFTQTSHADIFLEEPEQNLFPLTQVELLYQLLKRSAAREDGLFIATHSPYVLYALNNCMLGYLVKNKIPAELDNLQVHKDSWINPKDVAVWELKDGGFSSTVDTKFLTLQDKEGLIRGNYFDRIMSQIMTDFSNYSVFYD
ncbi:MAG: ATP-binding protein, partial [Parabacteroides sp.]|nr:ATP-binding protein [Parabacteroides sp.]